MKKIKNLLNGIREKYKERKKVYNAFFAGGVTYAAIQKAVAYFIKLLLT